MIWCVQMDKWNASSGNSPEGALFSKDTEHREKYEIYSDGK